MCEYCHCLGNNHDPMCPMNDEPDEVDGVKRHQCAICECYLWDDEPSEYLSFTDNDGTDYVCNDCLRDYLIDKHIAY